MKSQFSIIHFKYQPQCVYRNRKDKKRSYTDADTIICIIYTKFNIKQFLLISQKLRIQQF